MSVETDIQAGVQIYVEHWGDDLAKIDYFSILGGWFSKKRSPCPQTPIFSTRNPVKTKKRIIGGMHIPHPSLDLQPCIQETRDINESVEKFSSAAPGCMNLC